MIDISPAKLEIRTDPVPELPESPDQGVVLARCEQFDTYPSLDASVLATGTAGHFRLYNKEGVCLAQGSVGTRFDINKPYPTIALETVNLAVGQTVHIEFDFTHGSA
jgi:hypothetical protein